MTRSVKPAATCPSLEARSIAIQAGGLAGGVSLSLWPGRVVAVLGPNGAGKSTLVRLLSGVLRPARGEIFLDGVPLTELSRRQIAQRLAVVPQQIETPEGLTVGEVVASGRAPHQGALLWPSPEDESITREALARCDLLSLVDRPADRLSGGELRRVIVARALAQSAPLLLLDEPTAHLDLRHAVELMSLVRREADERGLAVLVVVHDLPTASLFADDVLLLSSAGVEAQGPVAEVLARPTLERVFEVGLAPVEVDGVTTFLPRRPGR